MKLVPEKVTRNIGRKVLTLKKNSPHIFFVGGIVGVVGSAVLACRATLKLEATVDEIRGDLENVKGRKLDENYTEHEYYKDLGYVYGKSFARFSKLYGPAVVIGSASIAALTGSHVQMTRRNSALTVTLAAVSQAYEEYRGRVRAELGEERELELHRAIHDEKREGVKGVVKVTDPNGWSPYARVFDESNINFQKNAEYNRIFLQCQQEYVNHLLRVRGHVFLNDVYDQLGFERTSPGAVVGWVLDGDGDNYIDFGLFEASSERFMNQHERSVILDFNVDGIVYDKI